MTVDVSPVKKKNSPTGYPQFLLLAAIGLLLGGLLGWGIIRVVSGQPLIGPHQFNGMIIHSPDPMPNFTLTDQSGQPLSLTDLRGKVIAIYFGYSYCPDACPTTLNALKQAKQQLGRYGDELQVVLVSLDPERDTPQLLADYLARFDPSFIGLSGSEEALLAATTPFGIYYQKREGTIASGYLIDHTASVMVLDKGGHLRLVLPFGLTGADIAEDLGYDELDVKMVILSAEPSGIFLNSCTDPLPKLVSPIKVANS